MSTDPFSDIAFQQEIGQPTYVELIYTEVRTGKTFPPSTATVENSLTRLAYGKPGHRRDVIAQTPPKLVAVPPNPTRRKYNLSGTTAPQTLQALKAQRIQDEFHQFLVNPSSEVSRSTINKQIPLAQSEPLAQPECDLLVNGNFVTPPPSGPAANYLNNPPGWTYDPSSTGTWSPEGLTTDNGVLYQAVTGLAPGQHLRLTVDCTWLESGTTGFLIRPSFNGDELAWVEFTGTAGQRQTLVVDTTIGVEASGIAYVFLLGKGSVTIGVTQLHIGKVRYHSVSLCPLDIPEAVCPNPISNITTLIEWDGIPRQPVNIFNMLARLTFRDENDPFNKISVDMLATQDGRLGTITPTSCGIGNTVDFWKQQGPTAESAITRAGLNITTTDNTTAGQLKSVTANNNWLWAIAGSTTGSIQDSLVSIWPDGDEGILESIEFLMLIHAVSPANPTIQIPVCIGPFAVGTDPAQNFDLIFRYTNSRNLTREFRKTFSLAALHQTTAAFPPMPNAWDTQTALGKGIKGFEARWESAEFILDAVDGSGLDQCTAPIAFVATGRGTLNFKALQSQGQVMVAAACDAQVEIEELSRGAAVNETQSIVVPSSSGGTWTLTFDRAGQMLTTGNIPWNATADQVRNLLQSLDNIGTGNVRVTGDGNIDTPYQVEFVGQMGARDFRPLKANGSNLVGASTAFCTKINVGTNNERQTITKGIGVNSSLVLEFDGAQSVPIQFNASLADMESALEGISTIGVGNVTVSGNTSDRTVNYQGPWYVDFDGALAGQNVEQLASQTLGYSIVTNWQGGTGVNDTQKITITASAGTFVLQAQNPSGEVAPVLTETISLNAEANQIKSRLLAACDWLTNTDLTITKIPVTGQAPDLHEWIVEFTGEWAKQPMPLLSPIGSGLRGAEVIVRQIADGSGSSERQKISLFRAQGGFYRLTVSVDNRSATTVAIPWDADAESVEFALQILSIFPLTDDVVVRATEARGAGAIASFLVTFGRRFGAVPLMVATNSLQCDPLMLSTVGPPPYNYPLPICDDEQASCSPGPPTCRPGDGDPEIPEAVCCDPFSVRDTANVYREVILQRDLFDPNVRTASGKALTIRDMAVLKGLRPSLYNAYLRDFHTGIMRGVEITTAVDTKMNVILIGADIDTKAARDRIGRELKRRPGILPSRMSWSHPSA